MSYSSIQHPSSYRDPSGFIFEKNGIIYRQVNQCYKDHFDHFLKSGCYEALIAKKLLIPHEPIADNLSGSADWYATIKPQPLSFISYPYEWCFDMLKDAALLTLRVVKEAMQYGMVLKDASPFNIQWHDGKLIFIDTLSFEKFEQRPWIAYRQFCESFLGPLLIMHYSKKQLPGLSLAWPEGIPLATISALLPKRSRFSLHCYLHIHLNAKYASGKKKSDIPLVFNEKKLLNLISSLELLVSRLHVPDQQTAWSDYYAEAAERNDYLEQKRTVIGKWLQKLKPSTVFDCGSNEGEFVKLAANQDVQTVAADIDAYCVNRLYQQLKSTKQNILPLIVDMANPTAAIGALNKERTSFLERMNADVVLALALIHHLAIGRNLPLEMITSTFSQLGKKLMIEFIPKSDPKLQLMLESKKDIYSSYTQENFETAFAIHFTILEKKEIPGSGRVLYLMQRHEGKA